MVLRALQVMTALFNLDVLPAEAAFADQAAFADSAYSSKEIEAKLTERVFLPMICEKGYRNKPLS